MRRAVALLLLILAPPSLAQAEAFDPLSLAWAAALTSEGRLADAPGPGGAILFPAADPTAASLPLAFQAEAPVSFRPGDPVTVTLVVEAIKPVLTQDREGRSFEVTLRSGDEVVARGTGGVAAALLAPGERATVRVEAAPGDVLVLRGAALALEVRPLMPALAGEALALRVGEGGSSAALPLQLPGVEALELQDAPYEEFLVTEGSFTAPLGLTTLTFTVGHSTVVGPTVDASASGPFVVLLLGEETREEAAAHAKVTREERLNASHEFLVDGARVRVHPGVGVVVPVAGRPVVECARGCPAGFRFALSGEAPPGTSPPPSSDGSVLIPPPRSTEGIPTSKDAPEGGNDTPFPALVLVLLGVVVAASTKRP